MTLKDKIIIVDTCVLMDNPNLPLEIECEQLVVPFVVLEELDALKSKEGQQGYVAQQAIKSLKLVAQLGSLHDGVVVSDTNTKVIVSDYITESLDATNNDNVAIGVALNYKSVFSDDKVVLLSNDFNVCVKASAVGLQVEELYSHRDVELYTGYKTLTVPTKDIDKIYENGYIKTDFELYPNQFVHLLDYCGGTALGVYHAQTEIIELINSKKLKAWDIRPKNREQAFAMQALLDREIDLVTISGLAGSGKTFIALAVALEHVLGRNPIYKRIMLVKPAVKGDSQEAEVGTVPGDKREKILPWQGNFMDNLERLLGDKDTAMLYLEGVSGRPPAIELESLTQLRGRSLDDTILIVDECQNTSKATMKEIVTRMGKNSKLVICGDLSQIDHRFLSAENNGLYHLIYHSKSTPLAAHIHFTDGTPRSDLAAWAAQNL